MAVVEQSKIGKLILSIKNLINDHNIECNKLDYLLKQHMDMLDTNFKENLFVSNIKDLDNLLKFCWDDIYQNTIYYDPIDNLTELTHCSKIYVINGYIIEEAKAILCGLKITYEKEKITEIIDHYLIYDIDKLEEVKTINFVDLLALSQNVVTKAIIDYLKQLEKIKIKLQNIIDNPNPNKKIYTCTTFQVNLDTIILSIEQPNRDFWSLSTFVQELIHDNKYYEYKGKDFYFIITYIIDNDIKYVKLYTKQQSQCIYTVEETINNITLLLNQFALINLQHPIHDFSITYDKSPFNTAQIKTIQVLPHSIAQLFFYYENLDDDAQKYQLYLSQLFNASLQLNYNFTFLTELFPFIYLFQILDILEKKPDKTSIFFFSPSCISKCNLKNNLQPFRNTIAHLLKDKNKREFIKDPKERKLRSYPEYCYQKEFVLDQYINSISYIQDLLNANLKGKYLEHHYKTIYGITGFKLFTPHKSAKKYQKESITCKTNKELYLRFDIVLTQQYRFYHCDPDDGKEYCINANYVRVSSIDTNVNTSINCQDLMIYAVIYENHTDLVFRPSDINCYTSDDINKIKQFKNRVNNKEVVVG